jgi:hypothetical protein
MGAHVIAFTALLTHNGISYKVGACLPVRLVSLFVLCGPYSGSSHRPWRHLALQLIVSPQTGDRLPWYPVTGEGDSPSDRLLADPIWHIFSLANERSVAEYRLLHLKCVIRPSSCKSLLLHHAPLPGTRTLPNAAFSSVQ